MSWKFEKEFRSDKPETIGETDRHFDLDNYKDWLEDKLTDSKNKIEELIRVIKEQDEQLRVHSVSNTIAIDYAKFCVLCERERLPLLDLEDYIKRYLPNTKLNG